MIISGGARSYWRDFATHLMKTEDNQRVRVAEIRGLAADSVLEAFREMDAMGAGTRAKRFYYHANINPREDESLTEEQWEKATDELEQALGLEGHSRFVIEHEKHGRTHRHVIWSRVDADTMTVVPDKWNYFVHQRTADALEKEFGHEPTSRDRGPDGPNPDNREVYRGKLSGVDTRDVKAELSALWRQADSGPAFAAALADHGYILAKGDRRDFVVVDAGGNEHSLGRRVGAKAAEIRTRMEAIERDRLPTVSEARALVKERSDKRADRDDRSPRDPSAAADGKPFELLADKLLESPQGPPPPGDMPASMENRPDVPGPPAPEVTGFAEQASPALIEGPDDVAAAGSPIAPAERSAFDRFAADMKQAMRAGGGEPSAAEGSRWLANRATQPPSRSESSVFGRFVQQMKAAMRAGAGEPDTRDGMTFWQRSAAVLSAGLEQAASWAKRVYQDVTARLAPRSHDDRDDPGMER